MRWDFIFEVMRIYGLPETYIAWVRACVTSAKYSILINGRADGFMQTSNGLRQGCALSPYLFILGLDVLTRLLQYKVSKGLIKGVKIARGGPTLTSLMYADDLLIFGEASDNEIQEIATTLQTFCEISGQQIGYEKSRIWFSKNTPENLKTKAMEVFGAHKAATSEVYLGAPIAAGRSLDFTPLLNKIDGKMQVWKSAMLSQAGKTVLIKSVIEPTMLYAMQTAAIPNKVLKNIQSKVRQFFWGKGNNKGMPLIAWESITRPKYMGGLGLKDLVRFAQTLHMKCLWNLLHNENTLWVKIIKAKYLQRTDIWSTERTIRCTNFWRAIIGVKPLLKDHVKWQIGDGTRCGALGAPWHEMWHLFKPQNAAQRKMKVKDLFREGTTQWDNQKLITTFGFYGALYIAVTFPQGPSVLQSSDKLVFTANKNGNFSIKGADRALLMQSTHSNQRHDLPRSITKAIWYTPGIMPRARIFIWKAVKEGLSVDHVLSTRLSKNPQGCALCGNPSETVVHTLFKCPRIQQIWRMSAFNIRIEALPDNALQLMEMILAGMETRRVAEMANLIWIIWKDRCKEVFEGKKVNPVRTIQLATDSTRLMNATTHVNEGLAMAQGEPPPATQFHCWTDASWIHDKEGGAGFAALVSNAQGRLLQYKMEFGAAHTPFHAELKSFEMAYHMINLMDIADCTFYTDCKQLHLVLSGVEKPEAVDWKAFNDINGFLPTWKDSVNRYFCKHVSRDDNYLADELAKYARIRGISCTDYTYPLCCIPVTVST